MTGSPKAAGARLALSLLGGLVAGTAVAVATDNYQLVPLTVWDASAAVFLVWTWATVLSADATRTAELAVREDPSNPAADVVLLLAAVVSLVGVGLILFQGSVKGSGISSGAGLAIGLTSVVLSWAVVHTVYTLRYARLYYTGGNGGISFNTKQAPQYSDFAYLSFTIGMTFQVSDTNLETIPIRRTALRHALLSYLFGVVIIATTINLVAGLSK